MVKKPSRSEFEIASTHTQVIWMKRCCLMFIFPDDLTHNVGAVIFCVCVCVNAATLVVDFFVNPFDSNIQFSIGLFFHFFLFRRLVARLVLLLLLFSFAMTFISKVDFITIYEKYEHKMKWNKQKKNRWRMHVQNLKHIT